MTREGPEDPRRWRVKGEAKISTVGIPRYDIKTDVVEVVVSIFHKGIVERSFN